MSPVARIIALALLACLLSGCGVKTAYNNADWLVMRWVNDRVSLTAEQELAVRSALEAHLEWHCASELPAYADFLLSLEVDVAGNRITRNTLATYSDEVSEFGKRILVRVRPTLIDLLASLDDQQVEELMASFEEDNRELLETATRSREALQREQIRDMSKGMRRFAGRLTNEQRVRVENWAAELDPTAELALEQRLAWQDRLAGALSVREDRKTFEAAVRQLLEPSAHWSETYRSLMRANRNRTLEALAEFHRTAPPRQIRRVQNRLADLAKDFNQLSCT